MFISLPDFVIDDDIAGQRVSFKKHDGSGCLEKGALILWQTTLYKSKFPVFHSDKKSP